MTFSVITSALAAAVAPAGTVAFSYPSGKDAGNFFLAMGHKLNVNGTEFYFPVDFDVTLGTSTVTVTNKTSATTWAQGATARLQLEELGDRSQVSVPLQSPNAATSGFGTSMAYGVNSRAKLMPSTTKVYVDLVTLGAPIALDADGICAAQSMAAAGTMSINGSLAVSGVVTLDQPRALQVDSSGANTAVITVKGTDVYGRSMSEAITLNGTTQVNGKKAFKTISLVTNSAQIDNPATVGTTDILGLPVFIPSSGFLVAELRDGKPVGNNGTQVVPFTVNQTDLLAGTAQSFISPVSGFVTGAKAVVSKNTIVTGGNIAIKVGTTDVTGLTLVFADGATPGTVVSDTPTTPFSSTTAVAVGDRLQVAPDSSFATSGDINGYIEVTGTNGVLVAGIRTGGGSTTTTGDTRGTYLPSIACDGVAVIQLLIAVPDRGVGIAQNIGS